MNRTDIFALINQERTYQDEKWSDREQYAVSAPHVLLLDSYVQKAKDRWTGSVSEVDVVQTIAKIAAIAVRALEEIKRPDVNLLEIGLR